MNCSALSEPLPASSFRIACSEIWWGRMISFGGNEAFYPSDARAYWVQRTRAPAHQWPALTLACIKSIAFANIWASRAYTTRQDHLSGNLKWLLFCRLTYKFPHMQQAFALKTPFAFASPLLSSTQPPVREEQARRVLGQNAYSVFKNDIILPSIQNDISSIC